MDIRTNIGRFAAATFVATLLGAAAVAHASCGDGILEVGEDCESPFEQCCDPGTCLFLPAGTVCNPGSGDLCDPDETCDGASDLCPADVISPNGTVCRDSAGICDPAEVCDGLSGDPCPGDSLYGTGTECRSAAGVCDAAENCDGVNPDCPADGVLTSSTVCRSSADSCDAVERCDGVAVTCPGDSVQPASTVCRSAVSPCDVAETCDGVATSCPADAVQPADTLCRAAGGVCDIAEVCDGASARCPADRFDLQCGGLNPPPLSAIATDCRAAVAKAYAKLMKTAVKTITGCHKSRDKGNTTLSGVNCNDLTDPAVDSKGKFASAQQKFVDSVGSACGTTSDALLTAASTTYKEWYISCPVESCAGVPSNPMNTMDAVAHCQACVAAQVAGQIASATLGNPTVPLSSDDAKCHGAIGKGYAKFFDASLKNDTSCQAAADEIKCTGGDNDGKSCATYLDCPGGTCGSENEVAGCQDASDPKGKVSGAQQKADDGLGSSCAAATLSNIDSCATDLAGLKTCNGQAWGDGENNAFDAVYEFPATICPKAIRTTIRGGCSLLGGAAGNCDLGNQSGTLLSVGWKGLAHAVDVTDDYTLAGDVTCPGTLGSCGTCTVDGISYDNKQYAAFTRCHSDTAIPCSNPFGTDTTCTANGAATNECSYFLGPPLAVSAGNTPTCTINTVSQDITGTVDPDAGTSSLNVKLVSDVYTGDLLARPCPICRGDVTPEDGVKGGTCLGGLHDGEPCDVQGFDLNFASRDMDPAHPDMGPSLDCPPSSGQAIGSLHIDLPLTTGTATKAAQDPCESPNQSKNCFCGVCGHPFETVSCDNDAFCDNLDDGIANNSNSCGIGGGVPRLPNSCADGICTVVPGQTDRGTCNAPTVQDKYCDGVVRANGNGIIKCSNDASCNAQITGDPNPDNWVCPGDNCGHCSISQKRSCFLDPIEITGTPDTQNPILVSAFCLPPSANGSVNDTTGSPGPAVVQTDSVVEKRY